MSDKREEKMKKIFGFVIAMVFLLGLSSVAMAGFAIQLKNGRILPTPAFWEEKGFIKFYWENGVATIPKEVIRSIGFIKDVPVVKAPGPKESITKPAAILPKEKETAKPEAEKDKIDDGYYKKQKAQITEKFEQAHERYLEASSRRDREAKKKAWEEFNQYASQVSALEEELKKKNNGVLPEWWNK
jgi:hypothetical protein